MARRESSQAAATVAIGQLLVAPYKGRIYEPACGSGGMFVQSKKFIEFHGSTAMRDSAKPNSEASLREYCGANHHRGDISIYSQESNATTCGALIACCAH